ncbi:arginine/serine-rich protein PNISR-like isoform X1 [Euwallacea fornicatus]|uniref:arginine/serine-rich protein PNISR-like isoform X1 n=1 Tax=Euwallacea fornicatus TaxID=995702 RepID=UPI0033903398
MYSGSESTDSQKYTQWAMNPAAYKNTPNDQVDWAALAHQWIIMKEAGPPPIPGENQPERHLQDAHPVEGGEAEMDVETEKEEPPSWNTSGPNGTPPAPGAEAWSNWNPPTAPNGQNWNWNNSWNTPGPIPPQLNLTATKPPLLPTPNRIFPDSASDNAMPYGGYNTSSQSSNNDISSQPTFWTGMAVGKITQTEIKPHNKRYSKVNVPTKVTIITPAAGGDTSTAIPVTHEVPAVPPPLLDTNRRKQLPAWIREGLEKMERDKVKQLEKEKEKLVNDEIAEKWKQEEKEKMEILRHTIKEKNLLKKSRFESDNENSEDDHPVKVKKASPPPPVPLTPEEVMLKVRKSMTEILLKVTNELIEQVCKEERQRYIKKRKALDLLASAPSGVLIKAKLGLGAYDEESSSEDSANEDRKHGSSDSEAELRESIKKRQFAFSKTEQEIKERLAEVDRKRGRSPSISSRSSSVDSRNNESQVDQANIQENSTKRTNSPNENASSSSSNHADSKSRRRSSSSSLDSDRKSNRRRSRSSSEGRSSKRDRSVDSYKRRDSTESKKRSRRSRSDSRYSKRSRRSRSRSYSSRKARKSRRSRSRSRSYDRKYKSFSLRSSRSKKSTRSRSRSRSHRKRSRRSSSRSRRSRSSSRGKRSHRR